MSTGFVPSFESLADARCSAHAARPAVALCRSCLTPRCGECVVKLDGVNHCATCIARLFPPPIAPKPAGPAREGRFLARRRSSSFGLSALRALAAIALYSFVALAAAAAGVALPFFANERLIAANRSRVTQVNLALSDYFGDVGRYPDPARGLDALLAPVPEDREMWRGPYVEARATDGRPARDPANEGRVLDVFGRPILYVAGPDTGEEDDGIPDYLYIASPGANGAWETPGVEEGRAPRDVSGDDVVQWVVNP